MSEQEQIKIERVDDVPLLMAHLERMGVQALLDQHFPMHGLWQGLSLGWVCQIWLTYIVSQADHRLNYVQDWADSLLYSLTKLSRQPLRALDFSDDRLARILLALSHDQRWAAFEGALNQQLLRVYELNDRVVRLDTTSASGYWHIDPNGLFQLGHSKDHRPDLPQVKVMLAALDPLGLPVTVEVVSGEKADDPLYVPAIQKVQASLGQRGRLYVGDCKMAALATRAYIAGSNEFYLCPLSKLHLSQLALSELLQPVWSGQLTLQPITRLNSKGETQVIAQGFEVRRPCQRATEPTPTPNEKPSGWVERWLVVRSLKLYEAQKQALHERVQQAVAALEALNAGGRGRAPRLKKLGVEQAQELVTGLLERYKVSGMIEVAYEQTVERRVVRAYGKRAGGEREELHLSVVTKVNQAALSEFEQTLGWQVYATNTQPSKLSLEQAVLAYRHEYLVEQSFGRLKGKSLALSPVYLSRDEHVTGLVRLLSVGLRVLVLLEGVVRGRLSESGSELSQLYAGNPKRASQKPRAEQLLRAFRGISLVIWLGEGYVRSHLPPLNKLQQTILQHLAFEPNVYATLAANFDQPLRI